MAMPKEGACTTINMSSGSSTIINSVVGLLETTYFGSISIIVVIVVVVIIIIIIPLGLFTTSLDAVLMCPGATSFCIDEVLR